MATWSPQARNGVQFGGQQAFAQAEGIDPNAEAMAQFEAVQANKMRAAQRMQQAQQLLDAGMAPVEGQGNALLGGLSKLVQMWRGNKLMKEGQSSASEALKAEFQQQQAAAIAARKQKLADRDSDRAFSRETEVQKSKTAAQIRREANQDKITAAELLHQNRLAEKAAGAPARIDPLSPEGIAARTQLSDAEAARAEKKAAAAAAKPKALTGEIKAKLALIETSLKNAREYQKRTTGPNGEFHDAASMLGDTPSLMKAAVQNSLYAKSGATAPPEEVNRTLEIYAPSRVMGIPMERDSTASAKIQNFIDDMETYKAVTLGNPQAAPAQQSTGATEANEGDIISGPNGQKARIVGGKLVPL